MAKWFCWPGNLAKSTLPHTMGRKKKHVDIYSLDQETSFILGSKLKPGFANISAKHANITNMLERYQCDQCVFEVSFSAYINVIITHLKY